MKNYQKFDESKFIVHPDGWLKDFLNLQNNGLTGNIEKTGEPFKSFSWNIFDEEALNKMDPLWKWVPFEQTAYHLDGATTLGRLLDDKNLKEKTSKIIYDVFDNIDKDGYIGPSFLKDPKKTNRWPHTVFFRAVFSKYYENHDIELIKKIENHYLNNRVDYSEGRNVTNIEIMLLVYGITKNKELLDYAIKTYEDFQKRKKDPEYVNEHNLEINMLNNTVPYEHGVTYNEIAKLGSIIYMYTGNKKYLKPSINAYKKLEKYHLLPDGCVSSNEFLRGKKPNETHETCDISDYTWSLGYLLKATKDGKYADLIEKCIYNAGIGAVLEDFKALQYFSGVNQIVLDNSSNHNYYRRGQDWMQYKPGHVTQCCQGNVNRFFPNFVSRMWMSHNKTIYSIFYGSSLSEIKFGNKKLVIKEETDYPFNEEINYSFSGTYDNFFNLGLRIPSYSNGYKLYINGETKNYDIKKGFIVIDNLNKNDVVKLVLNSKIEVSVYERNGVIVEKGPLLYSLGEKGKRNKYFIEEYGYPIYNIYSSIPWNYGINLEEVNPKLINLNSNGYKWDLDNIPLAIEIEAHKIYSLKEIRKRIVPTSTNEFKKETERIRGHFRFTPNIKTYSNGYGAKEVIRLYPYGACKIRMSVLPRIK